MGKRQSNRRTLKAASATTGIAAAVALSVAAVSGPGGTIENNYGEVIGTQGNIVNDYTEEGN